MGSPDPYPMLARAPLRWLYSVAATASILVRLPWWLAVAMVPSLRPRPSWTARAAVMTPLVRAIVDIRCRIGTTTTVSLETFSGGDRSCIVQPFEDDVYAGPLSPQQQASGSADSAGAAVVRPDRIGGTWYPRRPAGGPPKTVVMHVHGGGFVLGDSRGYCHHLTKTLISVVKAEAIFCPEYRLSGYEGINPFPAALQDVLTSYLYLTRTLNIPAANIVLSGDSAGANLCIAFLRYIGNYGGSLTIPAPSSCVLVSPWVNPWPESSGSEAQYYLSNRNYDSDYLPLSLCRWGSRAYGGDIEGQEFRANPYITPAGKPFPTRVPLFVSYGDAELLSDDAKDWAEAMSAIDGNVVETYVEKDGLHDILVIGVIFGFGEAVLDIAKAISSFLGRVRQSPDAK